MGSSSPGDNLSPWVPLRLRGSQPHRESSTDGDAAPPFLQQKDSVQHTGEHGSLSVPSYSNISININIYILSLTQAKGPLAPFFKGAVGPF